MADQTRWIRSYAVKEDDGRIGSVCIYEAIREHRRRIGASTDDFQRVMTNAVVRDDPGESGWPTPGSQSFLPGYAGRYSAAGAVAQANRSALNDARSVLEPT